MAHVPPKITQTRLKELLEYNSYTGVFLWKKKTNARIKKGQVAGCKGDKNSWVIRIDGIKYYAHRLAILKWCAVVKKAIGQNV